MRAHGAPLCPLSLQVSAPPYQLAQYRLLPKPMSYPRGRQLPHLPAPSRSLQKRSRKSARASAQRLRLDLSPRWPRPLRLPQALQPRQALALSPHAVSTTLRSMDSRSQPISAQRKRLLAQLYNCQASKSPLRSEQRTSTARLIQGKLQTMLRLTIARPRAFLR